MVGMAFGVKASINSIMGLAPEIVISAGLDEQGHSLSKLPLKSVREMTASKLLSIVHLSIQAHSGGDIGTLKEKLSESLRVSQLELKNPHRFSVGLTTTTLNDTLRYPIEDKSTVAETIVNRIDLTASSDEQLRTLKDAFNKCAEASELTFDLAPG